MPDLTPLASRCDRLTLVTEITFIRISTGGYVASVLWLWLLDCWFPVLPRFSRLTFAPSFGHYREVIFRWLLTGNSSIEEQWSDGIVSWRQSRGKLLCPW